MQLPENKEAILTMARDGYRELETAIAGLSDEGLTDPDLHGGWSIKDVLAHLAFWQQRMLRLLNDEAPPFAHLGEDSETALHRVNNEEYLRHSTTPLAEVRRVYAESRDRALAELRARPEDVLLAHLDAIRWNTWEHCDEHATAIRERLAARRAGRP